MSPHKSIDRRALVRRHSPVLTAADPRSPLSIGNGELAFTADLTGFQSRADQIPVPLCTMAQWGFHSYPELGDRAAAYSRLKLQPFDAHQKTVGYMSRSLGQEELYNGLRTSPHRANLLRLSLLGAGGEPVREEDLGEPHQELDLWNGRLVSEYAYRGATVRTEAVCHPTRDLLAFRVDAGLAVRMAFPYPSHEISGSDWKRPERHESVLSGGSPGSWTIARVVDDLVFWVILHAGANCTLERKGPHEFVLDPHQRVLEFSVEFVRSPANGSGRAPSWQDCKLAAEAQWNRFWTEGAALDFSGSTNPAAAELERRMVLSRYLTAIQCAGSLPPQETGLTCNSWYGKFHLEMHPWHAAHFPLWGKPELLERSLDYYARIASSARDRAQSQGYRGLRWPKMTEPAGSDAPSPIGPFLCWQQPHFIFLLELLYRRAGSQHRAKLLAKYGQLVFETADFMADYPVYDQAADRYSLGPPLIPVQENHPPETTTNPVFELEYWKVALDFAAEWKKRLKLPVPQDWQSVRAGLAAPPTREGAYAAHENCADTYGASAHDHPSFLMAYGYFAGPDVDPQTMAESLDRVLASWDFDSAWGWDFPVLAMCAARLGRPQAAVDFLLADQAKNSYLPNGHNAQVPKADLPLYLPGNGGLLLALAMMAGGWQGSTGKHPGFPADAGWRVESEGFEPLPF